MVPTSGGFSLQIPPHTAREIVSNSHNTLRGSIWALWPVWRRELKAAWLLAMLGFGPFSLNGEMESSISAFISIYFI